MKKIEWLLPRIIELKELAKSRSDCGQLSSKDLLLAKRIVLEKAFSTEDLFLIFSATNFLNAAIKKIEFEGLISYNEIKGNVSRLLFFLSTINQKKYKISYFIDPKERCAYVEVYSLQFSFHHIHINNEIQRYIESDQNKIKTWEGIRLQLIAGELLTLAQKFKEFNDK